MSEIALQGALALLAGIVAVYVLSCPFTKVEESFNMQAVHDILYHGLDIEKYDHLDFPGVVPRTFLGALPLALLTMPSKQFFTQMGVPKIAVMLVFRLFLGLASVAALGHFTYKASSSLGSTTAAWLVLITAVQFHLPFYMSRTLPNTLATIITTLGLADWIGAPQKPKRALALLTIAAIIFRCDVLMLAALVGLHLLATKKVTLLSGILVGACTAAGALVVTVGVDSFFWRRWLWPEGEVFYFNTILNKSHEWGVLPKEWYFTSALPRALHTAYPLAFLGAVLDRKVRPAFLVALGFVLLYSNLGHKEVRFLFPVLSLWNLSAAAALAQLQGTRKTSIIRQFAWLAALASVIAGAATAGLGFAASRVNYPGGKALVEMHRLGSQQAQQAWQTGQTLTAHIAVLPAMTGITRFGEIGTPWVYSKEEGLSYEELLKKGFDFLLSDKESITGYEMLKSVDGFSGFRWQGGSPKAAVLGLSEGMVPLTVLTSPAVFIHKKIELE